MFNFNLRQMIEDKLFPHPKPTLKGADLATSKLSASVAPQSVQRQSLSGSLSDRLNQSGASTGVVVDRRGTRGAPINQDLMRMRRIHQNGDRGEFFGDKFWRPQTDFIPNDGNWR